jgi:hypothetical protein
VQQKLMTYIAPADRDAVESGGKEALKAVPDAAAQAA